MKAIRGQSTRWTLRGYGPVVRRYARSTRRVVVLARAAAVAGSWRHGVVDGTTAPILAATENTVSARTKASTFSGRTRTAGERGWKPPAAREKVP